DEALHPVRYAMCGHLSPGGAIYGIGKRVLTKIMPPVRGYLQSLRRRVCKARITTIARIARGHAANAQTPALKWPRNFSSAISSTG
ncbi:hypothetical protein SEEM841_04877, partial [Salmonella enterica subsp. enterica serovar Senftenberg str. 423984-1]